MKKFYESPMMRTVIVGTNTMLAGSWKKEDTGGINPNPGGQGSFGSKEDDSELDDGEIYEWDDII